MKLKDFKRLNENWDKWKLTEGKLQYSVSNTGYGDVYEFFDENGEETEQTLGMMVLDLADAGVGGWAPEEQIDRMMAVNADPSKNQGGMQKWDSSVFEDYYGADNQKILQAWAKMSNMELEQVGADDGEYEDDGTNDFEEYYSESKKRNKIHEGGMKQMEMQLVDEIVDLLIERGAVKGGINDYGEAAEYLRTAVIPAMESLADAPAGSVSPMEEGADLVKNKGEAKMKLKNRKRKAAKVETLEERVKKLVVSKLREQKSARLSEGFGDRSGDIKVGDLVRNSKTNKIGIVVAASDYEDGHYDWQVAYIDDPAAMAELIKSGGGEVSWAAENRLEPLGLK